MKKIGILGGTFNPPHYGHLLMANEVLSALTLDEIWFMPNQEPPHKKKPESITNDQRLHMLEAALAGNERFRAETIEWQRQGPSFTYDTMNLLTSTFPDNEFFFIIGADMIEYLPKWHKIEELMKLVTFVGVNRPNYKHESSYPIRYVEIPSMDVSSSLIRVRMQKGGQVRYLLPDEVIRFIKENHLYGT